MFRWKIWTVPTIGACSFVAGKNDGEWCKAKRVSLQLEILVAGSVLNSAERGNH